MLPRSCSDPPCLELVYPHNHFLGNFQKVIVHGTVLERTSQHELFLTNFSRPTFSIADSNFPSSSTTSPRCCARVLDDDWPPTPDVSRPRRRHSRSTSSLDIVLSIPSNFEATFARHRAQTLYWFLPLPRQLPSPRYRSSFVDNVNDVVDFSTTVHELKFQSNEPFIRLGCAQRSGGFEYRFHLASMS